MELGLHEHHAADDPLEQFGRWFADVTAVGVYQPEAMVVSTATTAARPSSRFVLLRGVDDDGFRFFTGGESQKAVEIDENPQVSLLFTWHVVSRQVRVDGRAARLPAADIDRYFAERPRGSQVATVASHQSQPIADRAALDARYREVEADLAGRVVPRPERWTGYVVRPEVVEFWQGREFRFHDRLRYTRSADGHWTIERLQP
jgi:pyridoxamine 5'-phosphate oxidase